MPAAVAAEIELLGDAVDAVVPAKTANTLLVASWNIRAFGGLTESWNAAPSASPKRDWRAVALIAELISHFDVVAIQEVKRNTAALRFLLEQLGPSWRFITSDVTEGDQGNSERLGFVFDTTRVQPSGLVGEIVIPPSAGNPVKQFARTPYAASFSRGGVEFILTTVHVLWGASVDERLPEITAFANWMRAWADRRGDWNNNLLVLGDFNLDRLGNPLYEAFVSTGLWPPSELNAVRRTIFDKAKSRNFYDQIAWFKTLTDDQPLAEVMTSLSYTGHAGSFDFVPHAFAGLTRNSLSWRISDHYPLWVQFTISH